MKLLSPWVFAAKIEPYKRIVAVYACQQNLALAVSNHYLNLAEGQRVLCVRQQRFPAAALRHLINQFDAGGFVLGLHPGISRKTTQTRYTVDTPQMRSRIEELVLENTSPCLPKTWWTLSAPGKTVRQGECKLDLLGNSNCAQSTTHEEKRSTSATQRSGARCHDFGEEFLQNYLDNMGSLNTFG
ncbi:hypothetical protein CYMTET_24751 [Cymbomonas tetramitiformis]|uniref:Uncharacterized protein n=1 Tax=Cymbomonas tetramitiformis TaxID=36881 RepID=A0AAE0FVN3_9CHLO|nr:hypothetical protein CYMTET_24751 [Cymbomonas tetramitiformis]